MSERRGRVALTEAGSNADELNDLEGADSVTPHPIALTPDECGRGS